MASKGPVDVVLDIPRMNEVIVFANQYKIDVRERAETIRNVCRQMSENETLSGGDGELIKADFEQIANACTNLEMSTEKIVNILNSKLDSMIKMNKGTTTAASSEAAKKAAQKVGVLKE